MLSILANIARKVDRLENFLEEGDLLDPESTLDTAVDLLVYCVKYETYLADQDPDVALELFSGLSYAPYSDSVESVEYLLKGLVSTTMQDSIRNLILEVISTFNELEGLFMGLKTISPIRRRFVLVENLAKISFTLVLAISEGDEDSLRRFIESEGV